MHPPAEKMSANGTGSPVDGQQFSILRRISSYDYFYVHVVFYLGGNCGISRGGNKSQPFHLPQKWPMNFGTNENMDIW